jgi:hypothetical protein
MLVTPQSGSSGKISLTDTCAPFVLSLASCRLAYCIEVRRRWHAPARHNDLATLDSVAYDRRRIIRKDAGQSRKVADATVERTEQMADRIDVLRHRIEIADVDGPS